MCDQYRLPTGAGRSLHPLAAKRLADCGAELLPLLPSFFHDRPVMCCEKAPNGRAREEGHSLAVAPWARASRIFLASASGLNGFWRKG